MWIRSARSLVYSMNFKGPNTDPWGTLQSTVTVHIRRKFVTANRGTMGTSPTPRLRRQGACPVSAGGSGGRRYQHRAEVHKDDSADVIVLTTSSRTAAMAVSAE